MKLPRLLPFAAAAALVACDTPTQPSELGSTLDPDGSVVAAETEVVASAVGSAHREAGGKPVLLNFRAIQRDDGTVEGSYYYQSVFNHVQIHVDVTCMTVVEGNKAWIAGIISESNIPVLVGTVSYFYTFDNGEGADADADVVSLVRALDPPGEDLRFCDELPTGLPDHEVLHGNVNVTG